MNNFDYPQLCTKCQGYKTMPYTCSSTAEPRMCSCPKPITLAWECPRCKKINAPWKSSCDCTPTPFGAPIYGADYSGFVNLFNPYFPDPNRNVNQDHTDLNKNFTDK